MYKFLSGIVNGALRRVGLELRRRRESPDAFAVQHELVQVREPVIFDVGAAIGGVSARYRSLFPAAIIHAFEPFPESFAKLKTQFGTDARFRLNQAAVSDAVGVVRLNSNESPLTNSILPTDPVGAQSWGVGVLETRASIDVPSTTIDQYCTTNAIERIDILKLDIQGAELKALQGGISMLRASRIGLVYLEVIHTPTYVGQPHFEDYLRFFRQTGYVMLDMFEPMHSQYRLLQSDIIFVPERPDSQR
jgi:FkbM family methyltransferase